MLPPASRARRSYEGASQALPENVRIPVLTGQKLVNLISKVGLMSPGSETARPIFFALSSEFVSGSLLKLAKIPYFR
jgi:hypothetical protein